MDAIESSRKEEAQWPAVHLLWELHPAVQWLTDKVLVRYQRHEAPVIATDRLSADEAIFLFQGLLSNRAGRPVIAEWFGVPVRRGKLGSGVLALGAVLDCSGFRHELPNPGTARSIERLAESLATVVSAAREHLLGRRTARGRELADPLREHIRKLERWRDRSLADVEKEEAGLRERGQLGPLNRHKLDQRRREVDRLWADTERWVKMSLTTEEKPYVRLAAVFVGPAAGK